MRSALCVLAGSAAGVTVVASAKAKPGRGAFARCLRSAPTANA
jgi:hypothetical protein